tara:strand:+ start:781 stop:1545 length:765 start_codon:yes stop_codon:yes gene_type:complete
MKIASFNINGIKARLPNLTRWLSEEEPDIVGIQEVKSENSGLSYEMFNDLGYYSVFNGQKAYNGCGILSKYKIKNSAFSFPGIENDEQSRWLSAEIEGLMICNLYLPNGNPIITRKLDYKLQWMAKLYDHAKQLLNLGKPVIIFGDFNVIPQDIDCRNPKSWADDALYHPEVRSKFFEILNLGYYDALRLKTNGQIFTQWDYQGGAWQKNNGVRIDHFLLNPQAADRLLSCGVDKFMRSREKPSDHVPIWIEIS